MYLLACSMALLLAMYQSLRAFIDARDINALHKNFIPSIWLYLIPVNLMHAPFMASMFDEVRLQGGHPIETSTGIISAALALLGALIVLAATVVDGIRHRTEPGFGFSGKHLILVASASLVLVAATSHLIFTRDAGSVLFEAFRDEVNDMHCEASRILIRWDHSPDSPVQYRCPRGYMLNRHASLPFLPWPDYSEGYSADLAVALHEMLESAQKP